MRRVNWLYVCFFLCLCRPVVGAASCDDSRSACRDDIRRIELAYRRGRAEASGPGEVHECLRIRNAELHAVLERTYASLLSLIAIRTDLVEAVMADQARWQVEVDMAATLLGPSPERRNASLELVGDLLVERVLLFDRIVAASVAAEPWKNEIRLTNSHKK